MPIALCLRSGGFGPYLAAGFPCAVESQLFLLLFCYCVRSAALPALLSLVVVVMVVVVGGKEWGGSGKEGAHR